MFTITELYKYIVGSRNPRNTHVRYCALSEGPIGVIL